jgi:Tfp pilus assembly protein PilF
MDKIAALTEILTQDPTNAFARYGLAMEYAKSQEFTAAVTEFRGLLSQDADYAAAYYHGGQALEKLGELEQARDFYEKGIQATTRKGDAHTRAELQAALDLLPI